MRCRFQPFFFFQPCRSLRPFVIPLFNWFKIASLKTYPKLCQYYILAASSKDDTPTCDSRSSAPLTLLTSAFSFSLFLFSGETRPPPWFSSHPFTMQLCFVRLLLRVLFCFSSPLFSLLTPCSRPPPPHPPFGVLLLRFCILTIPIFHPASPPPPRLRFLIGFLFPCTPRPHPISVFLSFSLVFKRIASCLVLLAVLFSTNASP